MGREVVRLEPLLTRDYIDRAAKMRALQPVYRPVSTWDLVATWLVVIGLMVWGWCAW